MARAQIGDPRAALPQLLGSLRAEGSSRVLDLPVEELSAHAVRELAATAIDRSPSGAELDRLMGLTGGNAFFLEAVLRQGEHGLVDDGSVDDPGHRVPPRVQAALQQRLLSLSPPTVVLLRAVAVLDRPFSSELAAALGRLSEEDTFDALDQALSARFLVAAGGDCYQFAHALVRYSVLSDLNPSRRLRGHRRAAELLEKTGPDAQTEPAACEQIAGQYHASRALAGAFRGAPFALQAATRAYEVGAYRQAATFYAVTLDLIDSDDERRAEIGSSRGVALAGACRYDEAVDELTQVAEEVAATAGRPAAAAVLADGAWMAHRAGGTLPAWELASAGLSLVPLGQRDDVWARLFLLDNQRKEANDPDHPGVPKLSPERRLAGRVLDASPYRTDVPWTIVESRSEILAGPSPAPFHLTFFAGRLVEALPLWIDQAANAERIGRPAEAVRGLAGGVRCAAALGDIDQARDLLERARQVATSIELRGPDAVNLIGAWDDLLIILDGDWEEMLGEARILTNANTDVSVRWAAPGVTAALARISAHTGGADQALQLLDQVVPALADIPSWALGLNKTVNDAASTLWLTHQHRHAAYLLELARIRLLHPDFRAPMVEPRHIMGRLSGLLGDLDSARHWFAAARTVLDEDQAAPQRALCDLDEALLLHRTGTSRAGREAAELTQKALDAFVSIGVPGWIRRADRLASELS